MKKDRRRVHAAATKAWKQRSWQIVGFFCLSVTLLGETAGATACADSQKTLDLALCLQPPLAGSTQKKILLTKLKVDLSGVV